MPVKIETSYQNLDGIMAIVKKQVDKIWAEFGDVAEETARFGAKTAQSYTSTRPGMTTGKAGRIESGDMVNALRSRPVSKRDDLIHTQYGFVDEFDEYMKYQTVTGFTHNRSGRYVAPTFALRDSIGPTRDYAIRAGKSI